MNKKVLIVNQGKSDNLGDKAINFAVERYFKELGYDISTAGYTQFENIVINNVDLANYVAIRKIDLPIWLKWILRKKWRLKKEMAKYNSKYDYLVLGGGQLLKSNCYFPLAFYSWSKFGKKHAKKMYAIGIGVDSNITQFDRMLYMKGFKHFEKVIVRDHKSQKYLKEQFKIDSLWAPDLVFLLNGLLKLELINSSQYVFVMIFDYNTYKIHFKNQLNYDEYLEQWKEIIDKEIDKKNKVLLGYTTIEDKKQSIELMHRLGNKYSEKVVIPEIKDLNDFIVMLRDCNMIYSARMHALILGMLLRKEVFCIKISDKLINFENDYINHNLSIDDKEKLIKSTLDRLFVVGE